MCSIPPIHIPGHCPTPGDAFDPAKVFAPKEVPAADAEAVEAVWDGITVSFDRDDAVLVDSAGDTLACDAMLRRDGAGDEIARRFNAHPRLLATIAALRGALRELIGACDAHGALVCEPCAFDRGLEAAAKVCDRLVDAANEKVREWTMSDAGREAAAMVERYHASAYRGAAVAIRAALAQARRELGEPK